MIGGKMLYELIIHTENIPPQHVKSVIDAIGAVVDPLPGVDYKFTKINRYPEHTLINTVFDVGTDEEEILRVASAELGTTPEELRAEADALLIPPVVYVIVKLILAAIIVLGIVYVVYTLFAKDPIIAYSVIGVLAILSVGYLITAVKR